MTSEPMTDTAELKPVAGGGVDAREIELNIKAKLRLAFRKALADLPEIAPPEIRSVLSSVHMQDEFFREGKRLQIAHGLDSVAPRVEQECGAGAWSFMRQGVLAALTSPASGERDAVIEVTDAMVEDGAVAIDALWSEGQDRGPAFAETEREYQAHCRSTARAAIVAALRMEGK